MPPRNISKPKTVLITGCSYGSLGSALAISFHRSGLRVLATGRTSSKLAHLEEMKIETLVLDVTDQESIKDCAGRVSKTTDNHLDILVNNAGGTYAMPLSDASVPASRALFELNVFSHIAVTQAFLPLLLEAQGTIVNNTSINSVVPMPHTGVYNASKAAAAILTDTLRLELAPFKVKVIELKTGAVQSSLYDNRNSASARILPDPSIFAVARTAVEKSMDGDNVQFDAMDPHDWAGQVVKEILKKRPEHRIWKGKDARTAEIARRFVPDGCLDARLRKLGALDEVEKELRNRWVDKACAVAAMLS